MLMNTFCHLPGIGPKTERRLWDAGVTSWHSHWPRTGVTLPRTILESWAGHILQTFDNHANRNPSYFAETLPINQHWRLYSDFQDSCAFLDIETTGLSARAEITTIALYDGRTTQHFVNGDNLHDFPAAVMAYRLLVTYNGKAFDIPFIERYFDIRLPHAHIDLMHPLRSLGLKGGLKGCESRLGIGRPGLEGIDGFVAVLLWAEYRTQGNVKALESLLAYNIQDAVNLHALMVHAFNAKVKETPFAASHLLAMPTLPKGYFEADPDTVERVLRHQYSPWHPSTPVPDA